MKLTLREKTAYGIGAVGKDVVYALVSGFLMYYYNTVLGISTAFIGTLFMFARIFDALNDPIMGVIVEKTKTRFGKFRPWLFIGTVLNAVVLYAMFAVPKGMAGTNLLLYTSIAYVLWGITYTIMDIPYWSMIPALTDPGKDRENLSVIARSCAGLGFALPTALTMTLITALGKGDDWQGFHWLALIVAVFFVIAIVVTVINVKEKNTQTERATTLKAMFHALMQNDQALVVVVAIVIFNASLYLTQNLAIYFFQFDIGNRELFGVFGTIGGAAQILAMTFLPALRKKFGRSTIFIGSILTTIVGYAILFVLGSMKATNIVLLSVAAIIIFVGFGLATVLTTIFLADTVDYGQWRSNQRNESVIFSLQTFVVKLASAISVFIAGIGLDLIGLDKDAAVQSTGTLLGMRFLMIVIPIIGLILSVIIYKRHYKLDEAFLTQITKELGERKTIHDHFSE